MKNGITNHLEIVKGDFSDYKKLKEYHYIKDDPVCTRGIFKARCADLFAKAIPDPLGVIVYAVPIGEWKARNLAVDNYFSRYKSKSDRQSAINRNISYVARIIVDPRFHKLGIASRLLKETMPLFNCHWLETMTPVDKYMSLFTRNGFKLFFQPTPPIYQEMQQALLRAKVTKQYWTEPEVTDTVTRALNKYESNLFDSACKKFLRNFHHHEGEKKGIERIRYILSKIRYPNAYYLYANEKVPLI